MQVTKRLLGIAVLAGLATSCGPQEVADPGIEPSDKTSSSAGGAAMAKRPGSGAGQPGAGGDPSPSDPGRAGAGGMGNGGRGATAAPASGADGGAGKPGGPPIGTGPGVDSGIVPVDNTGPLNPDGLVVLNAAPSPNLPVFWIDVKNQNLQRRVKVTGRLKIITDPDPQHKELATKAAVLDMPIGISIRGAGSAQAPQKSYSIELRDDAGVDRKASVLGLPSESDWALVACWLDKPCMRNAMAYALGQNIGRWTPRYKFAEVYIDGAYRGLYLLVESIRSGKNRVNIAKPADDMTKGDLSGGYIFSKEANGRGNPGQSPVSDWVSQAKEPGMWPHQQVYAYRYPKDKNITSGQRAYIADYMAKFETMMKSSSWNDPAKGYPAWIDMNSFADYAIWSELSNNSDSYARSVYFTKQADPMPGVNGKLGAAPLWDYNFGFGLPTFRAGHKTDVWNWQNDASYAGNCTDWLPKGAPLCGNGCCQGGCQGKCYNMPWSIWWFKKMWSDPTFQNALKCRWQDLRKGAITVKIIDENIKQWKTALMPNAYPRHFAKWPEFRKSIEKRPCALDNGTGKLRTTGEHKVSGVSEPNCGEPSAPLTEMLDYEISWMRAWMDARIGWLDKNMPGMCSK